NKLNKESKLEDNIFLHNKKINANLDTYLGYKFKTSDRMKISIGIKHHLTAEYHISYYNYYRSN
ncbi:hypothetical protein, partial [Streptobacillus moniliformis]|uniref:hypothetical protein n=1 Tax=Streptobacillus moniliformis TaxID=34105 RepID=UPI000AB0E916